MTSFINPTYSPGILPQYFGTLRSMEIDGPLDAAMNDGAWVQSCQVLTPYTVYRVYMAQPSALCLLYL